MPHVPTGKRIFARTFARAVPFVLAVSVAADDGVTPEALELPGTEAYGRSSESSSPDTHRIEGEALRRFATLEDAIASLPGFRVRRQGGLGGYSELSFRGARASSIEIYVDGMRLNQDGDPAPDLSKWPLLWFTSLEARTGVDPDVVGSGMLARIDLSSHGADRTEAHARGGSHGTAESAVTVRGNGVTQWSIGVQGQHARNDYPWFNDNGTIHNPDDDGVTRMRNNGYWSRGVRASARAGNGFFGQDVSLLWLESRKEYPGLLGTGSSAYTVREAWMGAWRARHHGEIMSWEAGVQAHRATDAYRDPGRTLGHLSHALERVSTSAGVDARARLPLTGTLAFATDAHLRAETVDPRETPFSQNMSAPAGRRLEALLGWRMDHGITPFLNATLEARAAAVRFDADAVRAYPDAPEGDRVSVARMPSTLRAALQWQTTVGIFAAVAKHEQRAPSSGELLGDNHGVQANTALRPEETSGVSILHGLGHGAWSARWEAYWNLHTDPIRLGARGASPFLLYENRADYQVRGLELSGGWDSRRFEAAASAALSRAEITEGLHAGNRPAHHSPVEAHAGFFAKPFEGARLGPTLGFRSPWYPGEANLPVSRRDAEVEWGAHGALHRGPIRLSLDVRNLTDRQYRDFVYSPRSGRTWSLGLSLNL